MAETLDKHPQTIMKGRERNSSASNIVRGRDNVFIEGLIVHTVIGIDADEASHSQPVQVDLELGIDHLYAGMTDHIGDALNYSSLRQHVLQLAATHNVKLLEAFAERIAQSTLLTFDADRVRVRVAKPNKFADIRSCGVEIERYRVRTAQPRTADVSDDHRQTEPLAPQGESQTTGVSETSPVGFASYSHPNSHPN